MSTAPVLYDVNNKIATVTLNRPERSNAMTYDMCKELHSVMLRADADAGVAVIVLTGAGKRFCVGADIGIMESTSGLSSTPAKRISELRWEFDTHARPDYQSLHNYFPMIGKPIITMINGSAAGLGLIYACFSDMRFAADDASFASAFVRRGIPSEYGMSWVLPKLIGHANALDFMVSGRKISAAEAKSMGLVNRVVPSARLAEETYAYAAEMATWCPPHALRMHKRQIWDSYYETLAESNMAFHGYLEQSLKMEDFKEAVASFVEKRTPDFTGR